MIARISLLNRKHIELKGPSGEFAVRRDRPHLQIFQHAFAIIVQKTNLT
jgi:hypothetical protein